MSIEPMKPIQPAERPPESPAPAASPEKPANEASRFGPAYVLEDNLKSAVKQDMKVPFVSASVGKTLAALPPINPIGTASLTRLSLVKLIQPTDEKAAKP